MGRAESAADAFEGRGEGRRLRPSDAQVDVVEAVLLCEGPSDVPLGKPAEPNKSLTEALACPRHTCQSLFELLGCEHSVTQENRAQAHSHFGFHHRRVEAKSLQGPRSISIIPPVLHRLAGRGPEVQPTHPSTQGSRAPNRTPGGACASSTVASSNCPGCGQAREFPPDG